jgi:hypothetical protein
MKETDMREIARDHESLTTRGTSRRSIYRRLGGLLAVGLLAASTALIVSLPARADPDGGGGSGAAERDDWSGDHDGVYQAQRGDIVCDTREACGGPAAIPMNQPGSWYLPGGARGGRR